MNIFTPIRVHCIGLMHLDAYVGSTLPRTSPRQDRMLQSDLLYGHF